MYACVKMGKARGHSQPAFSSSLPLPAAHASIAISTQSLTRRPEREAKSWHLDIQRIKPCRAPLRSRLRGRISDGLPAYREALLLNRGANLSSETIPACALSSTTIPTTSAVPITTAAAPVIERNRNASRKAEMDKRYSVRMAEERELYTVADIRCEAFYGYPKDPYYYPVRRREIYMAMRDRIDSGNKCLVVLDKDPPEQWASFANDGKLVVGSLDVSMHKAISGRRCKFGAANDGMESELNAEETENGRRMYISSMAVREEWQRRGMAQRLLAHVDVLARLHGVKEIFLHVEWDNAPAVHVYTKCNFECVKNKNTSQVPRWLHFLAKQEHTLMRKKLD